MARLSLQALEIARDGFPCEPQPTARKLNRCIAFLLKPVLHICYEYNVLQ